MIRHTPGKRRYALGRSAAPSAPSSAPLADAAPEAPSAHTEPDAAAEPKRPVSGIQLASPESPLDTEVPAPESHPFESEEEERFFSDEGDNYEEDTHPSLDHVFGFASVRPAPVRPVSAELARSLPSLADGEATPPGTPEPVSPELRARRSQLRRGVAFALGVGVLLLLTGIFARQRAEAARARRDAVLAQPVPTAFALHASLRSAPPAVPEPARASTAAAAELERGEVPPPAESAAARQAEPDAARLTTEARALLAAGHTREGVARARAAIDTSPQDAEAYVLLAAGLQDLGDWGEARRVFATCLQKTKRGPSSQCQYFANR